jgi:hypothetical protein
MRQFRAASALVAIVGAVACVFYGCLNARRPTEFGRRPSEADFGDAPRDPHHLMDPRMVVQVVVHPVTQLSVHPLRAKNILEPAACGNPASPKT